MSQYISIVIHCIVIFLVILGGWYELQEATNLVSAWIWIVSIIYIAFSAPVTPTNDCEVDFNAGLSMSLFGISILLVFSVGWFWTGVVYMLMWIMLFGRVIQYKLDVK
ncbi:hypothetical protein E6Q11_00515 [Candidatus Dojkabacteria bacterium]|uniref:Uncharacterized protein n=1 Tax=Candidatus Dojkabacteria bacterium TaxID=2099670 RepID=A0A5C7JCA2_9BACT|nr:MAG: hypothetical protein E6Q11_00515 [Candidatus Dojkabacteria bacterium]